MTLGHRYKKNPKYTNSRHLCPYCAMRVSKSSDHWCAFGTMSNFEKRNLRSGHFMRPGHVTFGVIESSFFRKCVKLLAEQLWKIWRRYAPPFFSLSGKNRTGGVEITPPPAGARVKKVVLKIPIKYKKYTKNVGTEIPNTDLVLVFSWYIKFFVTD